MTGMERIIAEIDSTAAAEAAEIIKAAEDEANAFLKKTEQECESITLSAKEQADRKTAEGKKRTESQCQQQEKLILLRKKQEIIADVIGKAKKKLQDQEPEAYFSMLLQLLKGVVTGEKGVLFLSGRDLGRKPASFDAAVEKLAAEKGGSLTVSPEKASIEDGFLLQYGQVEENYSLSAIFEAKKDELQDQVHAVLW